MSTTRVLRVLTTDLRLYNQMDALARAPEPLAEQPVLTASICVRGPGQQAPATESHGEDEGRSLEDEARLVRRQPGRGSLGQRRRVRWQHKLLQGEVLLCGEAPARGQRWALRHWVRGALS